MDRYCLDLLGKWTSNCCLLLLNIDFINVDFRTGVITGVGISSFSVWDSFLESLEIDVDWFILNPCSEAYFGVHSYDCYSFVGNSCLDFFSGF